MLNLYAEYADMRKTILFTLLLLLVAAPGRAQTFTEWQDPHVNSINRLQMHSTFLAEESEIIPLGGEWHFNWVRSANQHPVDFWRPDYVEAVDAATLAPVKTLAKGTAVLLAAYAGKTRLIDNAIL